MQTSLDELVRSFERLTSADPKTLTRDEIEVRVRAGALLISRAQAELDADIEALANGRERIATLFVASPEPGAAQRHVKRYAHLRAPLKSRAYLPHW